ncbi:MAG TPA: hypothetical protein VIG24_04680 [Acidimicrobiia bacterium]
MRSMKKYVVAPGRIVNRKPAGHVFRADELEHVDVLVAAGIVIPEAVKASGTIKKANADASEEDEN